MVQPVITIQGIQSIGSVAAEEDPILEYFVKTQAVNDIANTNAFLVLGRKGSGKTALVRYFAESGLPQLASRALSLREYPWGLHSARKDSGASDIDAYVASWRYLIAVQLTSLLLNNVPEVTSPDIKRLKDFLRTNYGTDDPELKLILTPKKLKLSKTSFEPTVLGNKLFSVVLENTSSDESYGIKLDALTTSILRAIQNVATECGITRLLLHFDELDQGLAVLDQTRSEMLIGLILAARGIRKEHSNNSVKISPVIYLRTDFWRAFTFSDKNKISQSATINIEWDQKSLAELVDARLSKKMRRQVSFDDVEDGNLMRGSQKKFNHIVSRSFLRPRDVIQFVNLALLEANKREDDPLLFSNADIISARNSYSNYLKNELDDEIKAKWPNWDLAIRVFANIATLTFTREQFDREYRKLGSKDEVEAERALEILFEFSVLGYETRSGFGGSGWVFQYTHPESGWDASASRFKVHPGLKEYARLKEERF